MNALSLNIPPVSKVKPRYTTGEEIANAVTHGLGALLSAAALALLVLRALTRSPEGTLAFHLAGNIVFGVTLIILYSMSTIYHGITNATAKKVFAIFDHSSIYLLIAGTYTPYCIGTLNNPVGWTVFAAVWLCAILGVTFYSIFGSRMRVLSALTYLAMGWMVMFAAKPLFAALPPLSGALLIAGGISYTGGCTFYALKKIRWMHSVWHLFVLGGSICHFFSIYWSI